MALVTTPEGVASTKQRSGTGRRSGWVSQAVFVSCASVVIISIVAIFVFIGSNSFETFTKWHVSPLAFLLGDTYSPEDGYFGAGILLVGSISVTLLAVLISTPLSVGIAIFITQIAPPWARQLMQPVLELFVGIPSVIYGYLGLLIIVPIVAGAYNLLAGSFISNGFGLIAAALILALMILPTIASISVDAIAVLPPGLREASMALGATRWQTIRKTLLPASSTGVFTGIVLGMGRAVGETLAVAYVIGGAAHALPFGFSDTFPFIVMHPTSTITVQLLYDAKEMVPGTATFSAVWTLAFVLLIISFLFVVLSRFIASRSTFRAEPTGRRRGQHPGAQQGLGTTSTIARGGL